MSDSCCPKCDVDLDASPTEVRCWRCGWEVRAVDDSSRYADLYFAVTGHEPS